MNTAIGKSLGQAIKKAREKAGFTQEELAARANVTVRMLQKYEAGQPRPRYETLFQLADALQMPPEKLLIPMYKEWKKTHRNL